MPTRRTTVTLSALLLLAACSQSAPFDPTPPDYAAEPPIRLRASQVEVVDGFTAPAQTNFIVTRQFDRLAAGTRTMLNERLKAGGGGGFLRADITELVFTDAPIAGVAPGSIFNKVPDSDLTAKVAVKTSLIDERGLEKESVVSTVTLTRPVLQGTSPVERDQISQMLIKDTLKALDASLTSNITSNMPNAIAP